MLGFITGHWEILVIAGVVVLVFFGRRIPEIMRSLGKGVTQFKKGLKEPDDEEERERGERAKSLPAPGAGGAGADRDNQAKQDVKVKRVRAEQVEGKEKGAADAPPGRSPE